jgi:hypothetical protein
MPKLGGSQNLQQQQAGNFHFSGTRIEDLGATEYTLVTVVGDRSGSTQAFQKDMENVLKEIVDACQKSPRADNLMLRLVTFDDQEQEVHGFKLLQDIHKGDYDGVMPPGGMTALFDAACNGIEATNAYGRKLLEQDFSVNGIVFVLTDGDDNRSTNTASQVKKALEAAVSGENLESMVSILIGVNIQNPAYAAFLQKFHADAGFTQYVELKDATKNTLAKLAQFVSKSISSQSQALGTGGPSQSIVF